MVLLRLGDCFLCSHTQRSFCRIAARITHASAPPHTCCSCKVVWFLCPCVFFRLQHVISRDSLSLVRCKMLACIRSPTPADVVSLALRPKSRSHLRSELDCLVDLRRLERVVVAGSTGSPACRLCSGMFAWVAGLGFKAVSAKKINWILKSWREAFL